MLKKKMDQAARVIQRFFSSVKGKYIKHLFKGLAGLNVANIKDSMDFPQLIALLGSEGVRQAGWRVLDLLKKAAGHRQTFSTRADIVLIKKSKGAVFLESYKIVCFPGKVS